MGDVVLWFFRLIYAAAIFVITVVMLLRNPHLQHLSISSESPRSSPPRSSPRSSPCSSPRSRTKQLRRSHDGLTPERLLKLNACCETETDTSSCAEYNGAL